MDEAKISPNMIDIEDRITPLMTAARFGRVKMAKILIDSGANVNHRAQSGETALSRAIRYNQPDMIDLLMQKDAFSNLSPECRRMFQGVAGK